MNQDQLIKNNENLMSNEGKQLTSSFPKPPLSTRQNSPVSMKNIPDFGEYPLKEKNINHFSFSSQNNNFSTQSVSKFSTNINSNDDTSSLQASKENRNILNDINNSLGSNVNADYNSGILLPNPLPKKKKAVQNFEVSTTSGTTVENLTFSTPECQREDQPDDREEFRNYNRKLKGKTLQDRVEMLGNELEVNIKQEVQGQLKGIREEILQARQKTEKDEYGPRGSYDRLDSRRSVNENVKYPRESYREGSEYYVHSQQNENIDQRSSRQNTRDSERKQAKISNIKIEGLSQIRKNVSKRLDTGLSTCPQRERDLAAPSQHDSLLQNSLLEHEPRPSHHQRSTERGSVSHREYRNSVDTYEERPSYKHYQEKNRDFDSYGIKNFDHISALSKEAILVSSKLNSNVQQLREKSVEGFGSRPRNHRESSMNVKDEQTCRTQEDTRPRKKRRQVSLVSFPSMQKESVDTLHRQSTARESIVQDTTHQGRSSVNTFRTRTPSISSRIPPKSSTEQSGENESGGLYDVTIGHEEIKGSMDTVRPFQVETEEGNKNEKIKRPSCLKKLNLQDPRVRQKTIGFERDQEQIFTEREREIHFYADKDHKKLASARGNQINLVDKELECVKLMKKEDYKGALEELLRVNKEAGLENTNLHSIYINYLIAECYCKTDHKALSETYAKRTLWVIESMNRIEDKYLFLYYYGTLTLLAGLQVSNKHYEKAYDLYQKAKILLENPQRQNDQLEMQRKQLFGDLGTIKENIANVLLHLKDYEKAIKSYKEILVFIEDTNPPDRQKRLISCLKKLAQAYWKINSHEDTVACYQGILNLASSNSSKEKSFRPMIYCYDQLGDLYFKRGMHLEALRFYRLSLQTKSEYYGVNSKHTGHAFVAIGKVYLAIKEYDKALSKLETGNEILEATLGRYTIDSANCYTNMAQIKFKEHKYSESAEFYEIVLDIYNRLLGEKHIHTYRLYLNLIFLGFLMGDSMRINLYEQKLDSLLEGIADLDAFIIYNEMGNIFRKNNNYSKAVLYYKMSTEVFEALPDKAKHYERISNVYCNIASSLLLLKNYQESIKFYKLALKILYQIGEKQTERQIQINITVGKIYKGLKHPQEAFKYLERAKKLCLSEQKSSTRSRLPEIQKTLDEINIIMKRI